MKVTERMADYSDDGCLMEGYRGLNCGKNVQCSSSCNGKPVPCMYARFCERNLLCVFACKSSMNKYGTAHAWKETRAQMFEDDVSIREDGYAGMRYKKNTRTGPRTRVDVAFTCILELSVP